MHRAVRSSHTHTQIYTFKVHLKHFVCYIDAVAKTAFHAANKILIDIFGRCALVCTTLCVCVSVYRNILGQHSSLFHGESFELRNLCIQLRLVCRLFRVVFKHNFTESKSKSIEQKSSIAKRTLFDLHCDFGNRFNWTE